MTYQRKMCLALIGTALLFGSTACGNDDEPLHGPIMPSATATPTPEPVMTEAGDVRTVPAGTKGDTVKTFAEDNFLVVSPGTKFSVTGYSTASETMLDGDVVLPAEGEVLHFVDYNCPAAASLAFNVLVDGKSVPVESMPTDGTLMVSAPEDSEIKVEVLTDYQRSGEISQVINAKTAERTSKNLEIWYLNADATVSGANLSGFGGSSPYSVTVTGVVQEAEREGWMEGKGWANDGEAFLTVSMTDFNYKMEKNGTPNPSGLSVIATDDKGKQYKGTEVKGGYVFTVPVASDTFTIRAEVNTDITETGSPVATAYGIVTSEATLTF